MVDTFSCPHCGAEVNFEADFCRECGSDPQTGWGREVEYGSLDLPEPMEDEEYEDFLAKEFGGSPSSKTLKARQKRLLLGLGLIVLFLLAIVL